MTIKWKVIMRLCCQSVAAILLIAVCLLTGCRKGCFVSVEQPSNGIPVFHFKDYPQAINEGMGLAVLTVVHVIIPGKQYESVWDIRTDKLKPITENSITYGVVPIGFVGAKEARPLVVGETYEVMVSRPGTIVCGDTFVFKATP